MSARPRLLVAIAVTLAIALLIPESIVDQRVTRMLIAWNAGTVLYIVLAVHMMARSTQETMQRRARREDEGRYLVLLLVVVAVIASLVAIGGELVLLKDARGTERSLHIGLAAFTVLTTWAFMHLMFALHYAHDFYGDLARGQASGLAFPGKQEPDYGDFLYFAAIIGTSAQTADVSLTTHEMRRLGTAHCVLSFFFNTIILALTINIAASLI